MPFLDEHAATLIAAYNRTPAGQAYNKVAAEVYGARRSLGDPLSPQFEPSIVKGLIGFDMGRTMFGGSKAFSTRLREALKVVRTETTIAQLRSCALSSVDLDAVNALIISAYERIALPGTLHPMKQYHVGATKVFHWLFPDLFLMVDRNVAAAFRERFKVPFRKTTQPGYCSDRYLTCLQKAQSEIRSFGVERFHQLEPSSPEARIFDKIAFVIGQRTR
jgi:hypothetical protein